jgi:phenylacetate-CoA ligase
MYATPFVRYRTQDLAVLKGWGCASCGRPYQVWERIEGRLQEFILTGTGRHISTTAINMHDDIFDHIRQFQFFQQEKGRVVFRFIPKESCDEATVQDMRTRLMTKLGEDTDLRMERVEHIPLTSRGKHRLLVQEMELTYDDPSLEEALESQRQRNTTDPEHSPSNQYA